MKSEVGTKHAAEAQYLTFRVGAEEYAVEVVRVREVVEAVHVTRVPSMHPAIRGIVNLRGSVVPVIDLCVRFRQEPMTMTKWTCIVVVEIEILGDAAVMGLLVDGVKQVIALGEDAIEPVPPFGANVDVDFLRGMGVVGTEFVLLLDIDRLLSFADQANLLAPAEAS